MAFTEFGMLLTGFLSDANKKRGEIATKAGIDEGIISHYFTGNNLPLKEETVYYHMVAFFTVLVTEHVVTSIEQAKELVRLVPFHNNRTDLAKKFRKTLESEVLSLFAEQQALDRPRYQATWGKEFIGRHGNIEKIFAMLQEGSQLLTLVGVPGVGKTELAKQIEKIAPEKGYTRAYFVPSDEINNVTDMEQKIHSEIQDIADQEQPLLILDGCDKIAENNDAVQKIYDLLEMYPQLTILATSQVLLGSDNVPVVSLNVPKSAKEEVKKLLDNESVQLFVNASSRRTNEQYTLTKEDAPYIAQLCIGLGGLPLALLIAGSWVLIKGAKILFEDFTSGDILKRENKMLSETHETLNKVFEVSYAWFDETEQRLFRRLAIFEGECSVQAVESICNVQNDLPTGTDLENILKKFDEHHIIIYKNNTIQFAHATIRSYALSKLDADRADEEHYNIFLKQFADFYYTIVTNYMVAVFIEDKENRLDEYTEQLAQDLFYLFSDPNLWNAQTAIHSAREHYLATYPQSIVMQQIDADFFQYILTEKLVFIVDYSSHTGNLYDRHRKIAQHVTSDITISQFFVVLLASEGDIEYTITQNLVPSNTDKSLRIKGENMEFYIAVEQEYMPYRLAFLYDEFLKTSAPFSFYYGEPQEPFMPEFFNELYC